MLFQQLENIKNQHPELSKLLIDLDVYLQTIYTRSFSDNLVHPIMVASRLGIGKIEATGLLQLCAESGLLRKRIDIICPKGKIVIFSYYDNDPVPPFIECAFDGQVHDLYDCLIDIVFEFSKSLSLDIQTI